MDCAIEAGGPGHRSAISLGRRGKITNCSCVALAVVLNRDGAFGEARCLARGGLLITAGYIMPVCRDMLCDGGVTTSDHKLERICRA